MTAGTCGSSSIVRDSTVQSPFGTEGNEGAGKGGSRLALARVCFNPLPSVYFAHSRGSYVVGTRLCVNSSGHSCRSPGRERPRVCHPSLSVSSPFRFKDFPPGEKKSPLTRQVRSDQQAVGYCNVFIFLSAPHALYRLTVDVTFGISAHTQQLNGNKLSTFTSDKHYP